MMLRNVARREEAPAVDDSTGAEGGAKPTADSKVEDPGAKPDAKPEAEGKPEQDPDWIKRRLEQHERTLLKTLGFESAEEAKKARELVKEREEAKKTLEEKLASRSTELEEARQRLAAFESSVKSQADAALAALPDDKQAIVADIAGDDPSAILRVIGRLAPTWEKPKADQPASTSKAEPGPSPTKTNTEIDHKAHYAELKKTNPMAAADYRFAHFKEVTGG